MAPCSYLFSGSLEHSTAPASPYSCLLLIVLVGSQFSSSHLEIVLSMRETHGSPDRLEVSLFHGCIRQPRMYVSSWVACALWDQIHNLSTDVTACGIWECMCSLSAGVGFDQNLHQHRGPVPRTSYFIWWSTICFPYQSSKTSFLNKTNSVFDKLFQGLPKYILKNTKPIFFSTKGANIFFINKLTW